MLGVEALHTREVKNTHALLANHLNYIRRISLLENATAVMSFECARNAIETHRKCTHFKGLLFRIASQVEPGV